MLSKSSISVGKTLLLFLAIFSHQFVNAQLDKEVDKVDRTVTKVTKLFTSVAILANTANRTTQEFNRTVKVVKGDSKDRSKTLPKEDITPMKISKKGELKNINWEPIIYFETQLFPSAIVSLANYKGQTTPELEAILRPIGIRLVSREQNIPIKWEIECVEKKFFDKISGTFLYDYSNQEILLNPPIPWNFEALSKQVSSSPVSFVFRFFDDAGNKVEKTVSAYMRSINDCIYRYKQNQLDFLFTAFVQEEHPEIDKILKETKETKFVSAIVGYQGKDPNSTDWQVAAIWKVLHDRGFNYSSITTTAASSSNIASQSVRTFDNAIKTNQANCVDGTVVFASILRKIGIHSVMVMTNDHCFLGYYRTEDESNARSKDIKYLETTWLSKSDFIDQAKEAIEKAKPAKSKVDADKLMKSAYISQFLAARDRGLVVYDQYKKSNNIEAEVDVDLTRRIISRPIPFYID